MTRFEKLALIFSTILFWTTFGLTVRSFLRDEVSSFSYGVLILFGIFIWEVFFWIYLFTKSGGDNNDQE